MFFFILFFSSLSFGSSDLTAIAAARQRLESIPWMPRQEELLRLARDYEEVLGFSAYQTYVPGQLDLGTKNAGLIQRNQKLLADRAELHLRTARFYAEIAAVEMAQKKRKNRIDGRPTLLENTASARGPYPGWVFDLALKHSRGDKAEALQIIGVCGHDDKTISLPTLADEKIREVWAKTSRELAEQSQYNERMLENLDQDPDARDDRRVFRARKDLADIALIALAKEPSLPGHVACPSENSIFYLPEGLGRGVNATPEMRKKVLAAQSDARESEPPDSNIAAKYYHVYGSASVACEMVRRGHDPALVSSTEPLIAWAYRTIRMDSIIKKHGELRSPLDYSGLDWRREWKKAYAKSEEDRANLEKWFLEYSLHWRVALRDWKQSGKSYHQSTAAMERAYEKVARGESPWGRTLSLAEFEKTFKGVDANILKEQLPGAYRVYLKQKKIVDASWEKSAEAEASGKIVDVNALEYLQDLDSTTFGPEEFFDGLPDFRQATIDDWNNHPYLRKEFEEFQLEADAAWLFSHSSLGRRLTAQPASFRGLSVFIRAYFSESSPSHDRDSNELSKPKTWSEERFARARRKFDSWVLDWDWTVEQHRIGTKFALQHCQPEKKLPEPEQAQPVKSDSAR